MKTFKDRRLEEFDKLDYLFHGIEDGDFCIGDTIKVPIKIDDTGGERIVGYKINKGKCFCGGEEKKLKIKQFLSETIDMAERKFNNNFVYADNRYWFLVKDNTVAVNEDGDFETVEYLKNAFNDFKSLSPKECKK